MQIVRYVLFQKHFHSFERRFELIINRFNIFRSVNLDHAKWSGVHNSLYDLDGVVGQMVSDFLKILKQIIND